MKTRLSIPVFGLALLLILLALPGAVLAQPVLTNFSFTPTTINTSSAPANVTVNFTATDSASNLYYFEMLFVESTTGAFQQRGFKSFPEATSVTDSVVVTFPAFSKGGIWKVAAVFLADKAAVNRSCWPSLVVRVPCTGSKSSVPAMASAVTMSGLVMNDSVEALPSLRPGKFRLNELTIVFV